MKTVGSLEKLRGFMMVEILIVISIIVVSVLAALAVAQKSIYLSRQSLHQSQAAFLLEEGAEAVGREIEKRQLKKYGLQE